MNIKLRSQPYDEVGEKIIDFITTDPGIREIFGGKITRVAASEISLLIELNDIPIGFINLVSENIDNILFLDMGISENYRGKGYGKELLQLAVKYAFEILKVEKITLGVFENNLPAYWCYKAVGFQDVKAEEYYPIMGEQWKCLELEMNK